MNGSKRSGTRAKAGAIATVLAAALTIAGCQDGYPIAATRCDRFCDLTQAAQCGEYNPATCVFSCEDGAGGPTCYPEFDALLACLEKHESTGIADPNLDCTTPRTPSGELTSSFGERLPCSEAHYALIICADAVYGRPSGQ